MDFTKVFVKYNTALSACQDFQSDTEKHKDQMGPKMFTMAFSLPHSLYKLKYYRKQDSVLFIIKPLKMYLGRTALTTITL